LTFFLAFCNIILHFALASDIYFLVQHRNFLVLYIHLYKVLASKFFYSTINIGSKFFGYVFTSDLT
jgi:hypothetical protein